MLHPRRRTLAAPAGLALGLALTGPAHAADTTLAVLPLTATDAGTPYPGLGDAVAGMLTTDLGSIDGLVLVERARLDALLTEIELGRSGFVDPATAQQLGAGLGADWVLLGGYTVIDETLALDARLVDVDTGRVVQAADAQGALSDFVGVEKILLEGLLDDLAVEVDAGTRRRLIVQAPTETLDAFLAAGRGRAAEREGRLQEARGAYAEAAKADPGFAEAKASLERVDAAAARALREGTSAAMQARSRILDTLIAEAAPPTRRRSDDPARAAALALRWMALTERGQDCQVHEEMDRWWRARDLDPLPDLRAVARNAMARADELGLERPPRDADLPVTSNDTAYAWANHALDPARAVAPDDDRDNAEDAIGLVGALVRCFDGEAALEPIDALLPTTRALAPQKGHQPPPWVTLSLLWADIHADTRGPTPAFEQRLTALIEETATDEVARRTVSAQIPRLRRDATLTARSLRSRAGVDRETILDFARAVVDRDATVLALDRPVCQRFRDNDAQRLSVLAAGTSGKDAGPSAFEVDMIGLSRLTHRLVGCIRGEPGRYPTAEDLLIAARVATTEADPTLAPGACAGVLTALRDQTSDAHLEKVATWPGGSEAWMWSTLMQLSVLYTNGCVELPEAP